MDAIKRLAMVGAIVAVTMIGAMVPAEAVSSSNSGVPGNVTVPSRITGHTNGVMLGANPWIEIGQTSVGRSTSYATATQKITVSYRVWQLVGTTWQYQASLSAIGTVYLAPGSSSRTIGAWNPYVTSWGSPDYSVDIRVDWATSSGTWIGSRVVDYNLQSDYQCAPKPIGDVTSCVTGQVAGSGFLVFF
jgi:hypothetical protein